MRNGYFQIGCTGGGTVVRLVTPVDGGNEVTAREIAEYLSGHGIVYDAGLLTKGIQTAASVANNEFLFLVNKDIIPENQGAVCPHNPAGQDDCKCAVLSTLHEGRAHDSTGIPHGFKGEGNCVRH